MKSRAKEVRDHLRSLGELVNEWDPAGLLAAGAPKSEYECLIPSLYARLAEPEQDMQQLLEWLRLEVQGHFGIAPTRTGEFVREAHRWYEKRRGV